MKERYLKWHSRILKRDLEMLVFGSHGFPVVLFPTSNGRYYENKDFKLIQAAGELIDSGLVKVYCPDGIDEESWYNYDITPAERVQRHGEYEEAIIHDVIGRARRETGKRKVAVAGCSFGGYHALNLALRHPDLVSGCISMGGSFDIRQYIYGFFDNDCYFNSPIDYIPNLDDEWYLKRIRKMEIILGTGEWDICLEENLQLSGILDHSGLPHWLDIRKGAQHDWPWWNEVFPIYLHHLVD